ncbi:MAG: nicotinamide-nucleotide amidohydrolase family protein [Armatimonadetes bacterium]|nr:nicotinamide-nucleotide amidohydrolase family protein [Armatimonadota bacterium]NIM23082.1 nicotinamide-nucleotide amidohydrolase family protein [Armatimonadota bacterium]NIM66950.1 nicotinamide-nucleotide amidohydrolase family protein [Armatimonadota bacterium]NIM75484.1 nicotinamide-nucleotide amidohydrolase family protein [Armatimonadota bacterium]NIN05141.1 nicotinamide-nucleotide amidohydrolase family protein [Armatimonadota bacterium]
MIKSRVLHLMGIGESLVEEKVRDLIHTQANPTLAPLAGCGEVRLRITAKAEDDAQADSRISPLEAEIRRRLGDFIVGADAQQIENTVSHMLRESGLTLAVAESCSGGLISHRLTNIPGASDYLVAGLVCYSNPAKTALLGVKEETFAAHGAVSEAVALEMAEGVRKRLKADIGLSTTGIAGPTGGRPAKPVGLVYIAVSSVAKKVCEEHRFRGERESIKHQTANAAFNLLRKVLESGLLSQ